MKIPATLVVLALTSGVPWRCATSHSGTPNRYQGGARGSISGATRRISGRRDQTSRSDVFDGEGFRPLTLDLYLPASQVRGGAPVIIYVHGGGWTSGHTRHSGAFENWPGVLASLAGRGYVVASLNYRLSGEAPSPAAAQDVKSAVRWLRGNATRFGVDKRRIGISGGSAGGQLAALAGTSCGVAALEPPVADEKAPLESDCVQAVVAWYGVFDVAPLVKYRRRRRPLRATWAARRRAARTTRSRWRVPSVTSIGPTRRSCSFTARSTRRWR